MARIFTLLKKVETFKELSFITLLSSSESPGEDEEEEKAAAEAPPVFTSQKSTTSVTSSEPTGTDSHCEEDMHTSTLLLLLLHLQFYS